MVIKKQDNNPQGKEVYQEGEEVTVGFLPENVHLL